MLSPQEDFMDLPRHSLGLLSWVLPMEEPLWLLLPLNLPLPKGASPVPKSI